VNIQSALTEAAPPSDTLEVNDDIAWVDGRRFTKPDPFLFKARNRRVAVGAMVDLWKDPADVYRVRLPARRKVKFTLTMPRDANPDLAVFSTRARTIYKRRGLLKWSYRKKGKTDRVTLRNGGRHAKVVYAVIYSPTSKDSRLDAPYVLRIKR
jgi:hypothetical protein